MENPIYEVRQSPIAGVGVFACVPIAAGTRVHDMDGDRCAFEEIVRRTLSGEEEVSDSFQFADREYIDLDELSRSFNHSCAPTCAVVGTRTLLAIRDIAQDEEITFDYSTTMRYDHAAMAEVGIPPWTCPCACGAATCRGVIDEFCNLPEPARAYYLDRGWLPDYLLAHWRR